MRIKIFSASKYYSIELELKSWLKIMFGFQLLLLLHSCSAMDDFEQHQAFIAAEVVGSQSIQSSTLKVGDEKVYYVHSNNGEKAKATIVWIHGTPGSWSEIGEQLIRPSDIFWISLDRPGWGASNRELNPGEAAWKQHRERYASFEQQLSILKPALLELLKGRTKQPVILAGFSWGAPLAAELALNIPEVDGLLLIAGGFSPELMSVRWYHKLAKTRLGKWVIGDEMDRATEEMLALPASLKSLGRKWKAAEREIMTFVLQGEKDPLVPFQNAQWLKETVTAQPIHIFIDEDYGHFWPFQRQIVISECAQALLARSPERCSQAVSAPVIR